MPQVEMVLSRHSQLSDMSQPPTAGSKPILKREDLVGKQVISNAAKVLGTVNDVAFSPEGRIILQLERKDESTNAMIGADSISAIGDVILLKPEQTVQKEYSAQPTGTNAQHVSPPPFPGATTYKTCARCGFMNGQNSRFCIKCGNPL